MKIIITESQYKKILFESKEKNFEKVFNDLRDFSEKIYDEAKNQVGLDLNFLINLIL